MGTMWHINTKYTILFNKTKFTPYTLFLQPTRQRVFLLSRYADTWIRERSCEAFFVRCCSFAYKSITAFGTKALFWDQGLCPLISVPVIQFQSRKVYDTRDWGMVLRVGGSTLFGVPTTLSVASGCLSAKTQKVASKYLHTTFTHKKIFKIKIIWIHC